ncbi:MAG TPA: hypothetical protein VGU61_19890 [Noviherbaspirillum sp.]|jgi:hypothetical protein|uniref:hypothetical protein n=1 Tax=Noviherbaspirillum sp. TaxID=1926288 RepID=UPI002DDD5407|nr:hypothetical protein [Noviherbaspirillum sp.]HEV2612534.1 hypothetical protein [Noviherbaspirillum sp.]
MNAQQLAALKAEVQADPTGKGYAAYLPASPGRVVELLNADTESGVKSRMVTARAILAECGPGASVILDKLEAAAANLSAVKWAVRFLSQDAGIDVGNPATQAMINQLVAGNVLTAAEGKALKDMALQPASRAAVLGFGVVTEADLRTALES